VDRRSDVYSMAVTLYRVLAGRLPFHEARGQPLALLAKHIYNEPTMLAEAAGSADIPVAVASVVERALSKDPAKRPQTMQEFARALRAAAPPVTAASPIRPRRSLELLLAVGFGVALASIVTPSPTIPTTSIVAPPVATATSGPVQADFPGPIDPNPPPTVIRPEPAPAAASPAIARAIATLAPSTEKRSLPNRHTAEHRALEVRTPEVQACANRSAGGLDRLHVAVDIDASGRLSTRIVGTPETPLSRCIDAALRDTPLPARNVPLALTHTFTLRPTPRAP
jgi:serine/threonine-protein kinase